MRDLWNIRYNKDSYKPTRISWNIISLDLFLFKVILLRIRSHGMKITMKPTTIKNFFLPSNKQIEEHYRTRMCFFVGVSKSIKDYKQYHWIVLLMKCLFNQLRCNTNLSISCPGHGAFEKKNKFRRAKRRGCFFYRKLAPQLLQLDLHLVFSHVLSNWGDLLGLQLGGPLTGVVILNVFVFIASTTPPKKKQKNAWGRWDEPILYEHNFSQLVVETTT